MPSSGELVTSRPGFRDCGIPTDDGPCKFEGVVEILIDSGTLSAWFDCPVCGCRRRRRPQRDGPMSKPQPVSYVEQMQASVAALRRYVHHCGETVNSSEWDNHLPLCDPNDLEPEIYSNPTRNQVGATMTKSIDEMSLEELRAALRWQETENRRLTNHLTTYRRTVLDAVDTIRSAS